MLRQEAHYPRRRERARWRMKESYTNVLPLVEVEDAGASGSISALRMQTATERKPPSAPQVAPWTTKSGPARDPIPWSLLGVGQEEAERRVPAERSIPVSVRPRKVPNRRRACYYRYQGQHAG